MKRTFLIECFALVFFVGCGSGDQLKEENLKLKQENVKLQEEIVEIRQKNLTLEKVDLKNRKRMDKMTLQTNLGLLRTNLSMYYGDKEGIYPPSLDSLVPKYLPRIPDGDWEYNPKKGDVVLKSHPEW